MFGRSLYEVWRTFRLAIPMILGQLIGMSMHIIDVAMIGRLDGDLATISQAALGFAGQALYAFIASGFGLCIAVTVLCAQAFGSGRRDDLVSILQHGILLVLGFSLPLAIVVHLGADALRILNPPEAVFEEARTYLRYLGWATVALLLAAVQRNFCEAQDRPWLPFFCSLTGVALNVFLNWVLIFGNLGAPRLGLEGAGIATLSALSWNALFLFVILLRHPAIPVTRRIFDLTQLQFARLRRLLKLGVPSMAQLFVEILAFNVAGIFMVWLGIVPAASHTIAISFAALTFMVPLGYSMAVSVRVAQAASQQDQDRVRRIGLSSLAATALFMLATATAYFFFHDLIPHFYSTDPEVLQLAGALLLIVAIFQLSDGVQVVALGALRGLEDVNLPLGIVLVSYWLISLPVGYALAFHWGAGPTGVWWGLVVGLTLAASLATARFVWLTRPTIWLDRSGEADSPTSA
jgi:MATE family multidrug resistance protein